jgi:hypothetical protein
VTEGGLRTPLIIRWTDESINGQVFEETINIEDIYPTLMAAIDIDPPEDQDGNSFYNSLQQLDSPPQKERFWEAGTEEYGVLTSDGSWRLRQPPGCAGVVGQPLLYDLDADPTAAQFVSPTPLAQLMQMTEAYDAWYRDIHTVKTQYNPDLNGGGILTGMDFLRTPGFGEYTFGIGISDVLDGQIAAQAGIWNMSRTGDTVIAQYGDLILSGDINNNDSCHSIVVTGSFSRQVAAHSPPDLIKLTLYIDGIEAQSGSIEATLAIPDPTVPTIIGNPSQFGTLLAPIILNTTLSRVFSPWTVEAFGHEVCVDI